MNVFLRYLHYLVFRIHFPIQGEEGKKEEEKEEEGERERVTFISNFKSLSKSVPE